MTFSEYMDFRLTEALISFLVIFALLPFVVFAFWVNRKDKKEWWE